MYITKQSDAAVITKRKISKNSKKPAKKGKRKIILVRVEEEEASYSSKKRPAVPIIREIIKNFHNEDIVVVGRYPSQIRHLAQTFGDKIKILDKVVDGKALLSSVNVFVGSGGTMTAESALLGIPTISYNAVPNIIEAYLVKKKLVLRKNKSQANCDISQKASRFNPI